MSKILYYVTVALDVIGVLFAFVFIWLNAFVKRSDMESRNAEFLDCIKKSIIWCFIFSLLMCLMETHMTAADAIKRMSNSCSMIAISWLVVVLGCLIAMIIVLVSRSSYRSTITAELKKLISHAIPSAIIGIVLSWALG